MNWWKRVREQFRPIRQNHPTFGHMTYMRMPDESRSYWEGQAKFGASGSTIEVFVDGDELGPGESQVRCFEEIARGFPAMWPDIEKLLNDSHAEAGGPRAQTQGATSYKVHTLTVPRAVAPDMAWDVSFELEKEERYLFTVEFRGWTPTGQVRAEN